MNNKKCVVSPELKEKIKNQPPRKYTTDEAIYALNENAQPIDEQYLGLMEHIIDTGVDKGDRTGTGTRSIFGHHLKHDMRGGFPLLTTKKMFTKGIISELLWFLRGETNQTSLVKQGNNIWLGDGCKKWALESNHKVFATYTLTNTPKELMKISNTNIVDSKQIIESLDENGRFINIIDNCMYFDMSVFGEYVYNGDGSPEDKLLLEGIFKSLMLTYTDFGATWGELGPIYGKQWRDWDGIDQIRNVVETLENNPNSRRMMVNAWNVSEMSKAVLPPCHYGFQFYTRPLSNREIYHTFFMKNIYPSAIIEEKGVRNLVFLKYYKPDQYLADSSIDLILERYPDTLTTGISMLWNQRSVDTFLGLPFNIASYATLLQIIGKKVKMEPVDLNGMLGDTHLYSNHLELAEEQINREAHQMCYLNITDDIDWDADIDSIIFSLEVADFKFTEYKSEPAMKAPLSN